MNPIRPRISGVTYLYATRENFSPAVLTEDFTMARNKHESQQDLLMPASSWVNYSGVHVDAQEKGYWIVCDTRSDQSSNSLANTF